MDALDLDDYYLFHAIRGELLARIGRPLDAASALEQAIDRSDNAAERAFLRDKQLRLAGPVSTSGALVFSSSELPIYAQSMRGNGTPSLVVDATRTG